MGSAIRQSSLQTLGVGSVLGIFQRGALPVNTGDLVDQVFGAGNDRGCLVVSGANGIVGAGKTTQLASRLAPFGITVAALDFPGAPAGLSRQYAGLARSFGKKQASQIMSNVIQFTYDGKNLPKQLATLKPKFLLEAVPEILEIKRAHYELFRSAFPGIQIRSVTSGFPARELGVGIAHPAFPHEINKVWEIVEPKPSAVTQLLWALGLIPVMVSDEWSFVLDVLFCGLMLAACRYNETSNMPFWKIDKFVRQQLGPNPFRAHDVIGAKGSSFLTWSCLDHLAKHYGPLFEPAKSLTERKESGQNWYPHNHFRPIVNWSLDEEERAELDVAMLGPVFQTTSLLLHEQRSTHSQLNAIGELCAQFRQGALALARRHGTDGVAKIVAAYHTRFPAAATSPWYPDEFNRMDSPEWRQLYVNAEHDGHAGVITISREAYSQDVDAELNRAIDWLKAEGISRVIVTGDFHLSTQMTGAEITDFFPALKEEAYGVALSERWSRTARRLYYEFTLSVGFVNGKRCLGGFLELLQHCHYLVAVETADLGMPEVTLPVVPGMEGCHWILRKATPESRDTVLRFLLEGSPVKARDAVGWLIEYAGPLGDCIKACWSIAKGEAGIARRAVNESPIHDLVEAPAGLSEAANPNTETARRAILKAIEDSCRRPLTDALAVQAKHSAAFMCSPACRTGAIGSAYEKTVSV
jgi:enoyl-CoA hydratase/carnithine racemase/3-hydroxyacyl-CoA dehydrogenase